MADSRRFQTQINSIMDIMTRAVVKQICTLVESDVVGLKKELERARRHNAALGDKMRVLENEVEVLRVAKKAGARKDCHSVCIQTEASDSPSITEVFDKEWCTSLWDGRKSRQEENKVDMDPVMTEEKEDEEEPENNDHCEVQSIKIEQPELDIRSVCTTTKKIEGAAKRKMSSVPSVRCCSPENLADDNDDDLYFVSSGFKTHDTRSMPCDVPAATTTKFICMDGTVQDVVFPNHDQSVLNEYCMPIDFMEGENTQTVAFKEQHDDSQNLVMGIEHMVSSADSHYCNTFSMCNQPAKIKYVCPECGKAFLRQNGLTLHMKSHRRKKATACRKKTLLKVQKILRQEKTTEKPKKGFTCEICGKLLHSKATLRVHYSVHTGERPYSCSFCGRGFTQKGNLNSHERIHRGERPYVCITCGKGFTQKGNLTQHLAIHTKIRIKRVT
ncbi:zinc finger and BTB domain-containing protein 6 [Trichomycterus rosablanca]|uniref:zinc finger and BTB domain-containing protein 6 n=1 Tax=Trichomycterus rosablanca TaxID=2290929 RepID=UPI002F35C58C